VDVHEPPSCPFGAEEDAMEVVTPAHIIQHPGERAAVGIMYDTVVVRMPVPDVAEGAERSSPMTFCSIYPTTFVPAVNVEYVFPHPTFDSLR
jgi:hypothetical protein